VHRCFLAIGFPPSADPAHRLHRPWVHGRAEVVHGGVVARTSRALTFLQCETARPAQTKRSPPWPGPKVAKSRPPVPQPGQRLRREETQGRA